MGNVSKRKQIEERIVNTSKSVKVSKPSGSWLDDREITEFLDAWCELVEYYQEYDDTMLDVEVVREYVRFVRILNHLLSEVGLEEKHHEQAGTILEELEGYMDEIMKEAVTNKYGG
jgi:hypothetical protein